MKRRLVYLTTILSLLFLFGCAAGKNIKEYEPKSPDEEAIIRVLVVSIDAIDNKDIPGHLAIIHNNASMMVFDDMYNRPILSKELYAKKLPSRIADMGGEYYISSITVSGNEAIVNCSHIIRGYKSQHKITMVKENGNWYIMRWVFGTYT
jgi:hypothetical protein